MVGAGHGARGRRLALVLTACLTASAAVAGPANAATAKHPAMFYVGFSKQEIMPTQVPFEYLGGEGYQRVGTTVVPVSSVGAQSQYPGLDQVNAELPRSLAGAGEVTIALTCDAAIR